MAQSLPSIGIGIKQFLANKKLILNKTHSLNVEYRLLKCQDLKPCPAKKSKKITRLVFVINYYNIIRTLRSNLINRYIFLFIEIFFF